MIRLNAESAKFWDQKGIIGWARKAYLNMEKFEKSDIYPKIYGLKNDNDIKKLYDEGCLIWEHLSEYFYANKNASFELFSWFLERDYKYIHRYPEEIRGFTYEKFYNILLKYPYIKNKTSKFYGKRPKNSRENFYKNKILELNKESDYLHYRLGSRLTHDVKYYRIILSMKYILIYVDKKID